MQHPSAIPDVHVTAASRRDVDVPGCSLEGSSKQESNGLHGVDLANELAVADCTARMVAGDSSAYEMLFRSRCGLVEAESARRLGRRRDLVDDVAQEAWLRVARRPLRFDNVPTLDAWLRRLVRSAAIDMLRAELSRRLRETEVARDRAEAVVFLDDYELFEHLQVEVDAIEGLTPDERALFELKARTDATTTRIAGWLGVGRAAVDSKLRRAAERARAMRAKS